MLIISRFVSRLVAIHSRITIASVSLTLLVSLGWWSLERDVDGKAPYNPPPQAAPGFLYILNECGPTCPSKILGFKVNEATGSLTPLPTFPAGTGVSGNSSFRERLAIDGRNHRLYVINDGSKTISAFRIDPGTGALTAIFTIRLPTIQNGGPWSTIAVADQPPCGLLVAGDMPTSPPGHLASFQIKATTATLFGAVKTTTGVVARSIAFSQNGKYIYTGGGNQMRFAGFAVGTNGLTPLNGSPFQSGSDNPLAYVTDDQGRLFMVNRFFQEQQLRVFATTNGIPGPPPSGSPRLAGLKEAGQGLLHPNGFYIVSDFGSSDHVGVYRISGSGSTTTLSPVNSPFHSGGEVVNLLALTHNGRFLFAVNINSRNITTFSVNTISGALTNIGTQPESTLGSLGPLNGIAYFTPLDSPTFTKPTITITPTTVRLGTASLGQSTPVTVKVASECGLPSGNVSLAVDAKTPLSKPLSADGSATFDIFVPRIPADITLHAVFPAQGGFDSNSATETFKIKAAIVGIRTETTISAPTITLTGFGQNALVTVNVTAVLDIPVGNVSLTVDNGTVVTKVLTNGRAKFTIKRPFPGNHSLEAAFTGTARFASSKAVGTLVVKGKHLVRP